MAGTAANDANIIRSLKYHSVERVSIKNWAHNQCAKSTPMHLFLKIHVSHFSRTSQVLVSEQIKMRAVMQGKEQAASGNNSDHEESRSSREEIKILKEELHKVKAEMQELQRDYTELQKINGKVNNKRRSLSGWTLGWRKIINSGFFNGKMDGDETRVEQKRSNSSGLRVSLRRRLSMT